MGVTDVYANGFDEECGTTISATVCPESAGWVRTEGGDINCTECGLIVEEYRIDHGPERRFDDRTERTGAPLTMARHDRGLSTEIGFDRDSKGNVLSGRKRRQLGRLRVQHHRGRWRGKAERNLAYAFAEIARIVSGLESPNVVREEASLVYRRAQQENLIVGRSIETMAAGHVYAACRCGGYMRTLEEVAQIARCSRTDRASAPSAAVFEYRPMAPLWIGGAFLRIRLLIEPFNLWDDWNDPPSDDLPSSGQSGP